MISFALSEDQSLILDTVRRFAAEELRPRLRELEKGGIPPALARTFHGLGVTLVDVPEAWGGLGLGTGTAALVHEELAFGDPGAAVALWEPQLVPAALVELGDEAQARRWLARLGRGAVAWSDGGTPTTARRDGDHWILDGDKAFVVNGDRADVVVVFAREGDAVHGFVVDGTQVTAGPRAEWVGLGAVSANDVSLRGCRVAEADRLAKPALPRFFARAQIVSAARQVGLARAGYELALAYTQDRIAFGKPVAHFQSVAFDLAEMLMEVESARWLVWRAAAELDAGDGVVAAAKAAVHANQAAWTVADQAVQLLGGAGFIQDFPAEKWLRDTKALAVLGQVDEVSRQIVSGALLGEAHETVPGPTLQPVVT